MDFFATKFPALADFVVYQELGTPFATAAFTGHEKGGIYGVETTPRRMLTRALHAATPVPGLFLSGQDVMTPGIAGAFWGGMFGAAAIDSWLFRRFATGYSATLQRGTSHQSIPCHRPSVSWRLARRILISIKPIAPRAVRVVKTILVQSSTGCTVTPSGSIVTTATGRPTA